MRLWSLCRASAVSWENTIRGDRCEMTSSSSGISSAGAYTPCDSRCSSPAAAQRASMARDTPMASASETVIVPCRLKNGFSSLFIFVVFDKRTQFYTKVCPIVKWNDAFLRGAKAPGRRTILLAGRGGFC